MSSGSIKVLNEILKLASQLSLDPSEYAELSAQRRKAIRSDLERAIMQLSTISQTIDLVRQPKHVFDPTDPKVIGKMVAGTLLLQDKEPLAEVSKNSFYGAGVYALYYRGSFSAYKPIASKDHPIYVGKADPDELHALSAQAQGTRLYSRLKDHLRSIGYAENLDIADFDCRYLVVRSAWVETAEDLLIGQFKPVWNAEMKVCYGFGKHGDSASTRSNERSPWDTLHPGRPWAKSADNTPNKRSIAQIQADIANHFSKNLS